MQGVEYRRNSGTIALDKDSRKSANIAPSFVGVEIIEEGATLYSCQLPVNEDGLYRFGTANSNDIVLQSPRGIISRNHGAIAIRSSGIVVEDYHSTNGIFINGKRVNMGRIGANDVVTIGTPTPGRPHVEFKFTFNCPSWTPLNIAGKESVTIGRVAGNDLVLNLSPVSARHATLRRIGQGKWMLTDHNSFNGTFVKGVPLSGQTVINDGEIVNIANASVMVSGETIYHNVRPDGVEISAVNLVKTRPHRGGRRTVTDDISLRIGKGEFVAIVGGSGAGKTTLMNEINGTSPADSGFVTIDGVDLYAHYGILKNSIGYVPQQDIVYDNLKLLDMLVYEAELRMLPDHSKQERIDRSIEVLEMLGLGHEMTNYVKSLSGGQKKRASIAVELLADPKLLFLDEPTSGLDPGTEKKLMSQLAKMAREGRTIVLVTHTTQNIDLCDRVIMLGDGGKLCYSGSPKEALSFFKVDDFIDIYNKVEDDPEHWKNEFVKVSTVLDYSPQVTQDKPTKKRSPNGFRQFATLSRRLVKLIVNDLPRLLLLVGQAPLLGILTALVGGQECFSVYEDAKATMFALLCACIWMGLLDSIQEICKERAVLMREYAGGLNLVSYILSKVVIFGLLCILQTVLMFEAFVLLCGLPEANLINVHAEMLFTLFSVTFSSMCIGLVVSSLFSNSDRALAVAPLLIMPQVLFSGFLFELSEWLKFVAYFIQCKWGMEALGTSADLNGMDLKIYESDMITPQIYEHEWEAEFDFVASHLFASWGYLAIFGIVALIATYICLRISLKKRI